MAYISSSFIRDHGSIRHTQTKMNFLQNLLPKRFKKTPVSEGKWVWNTPQAQAWAKQVRMENQLRKEKFLRGEPSAVRRYYHRKNIEADLNWEHARQFGLRSSQFPVKMKP